jgi:hypothetical protein
MNMFKTLALTACLVLMASTAFGAARDVRPGLVQAGGEQPVTLFTFSNVLLDATDECLAFTAQTQDTCEDFALNTVTLHRPIFITNLSVTVGIAANAASTCDMFLEIDGATAGNEMTAFVALPIGETTSQAQQLVVQAGSSLSVNITDASGCFDTTAPNVTVNVEGFFIR